MRVMIGARAGRAVETRTVLAIAFLGLGKLVLRGLAAIALCAALLPGWASAQDDLTDRVEELQRQLNDLQRQVYSGGGAPAATNGATGSVAANQEVRIQQLDQQVRSVTGQLEETSFKLQQLSQRL